MPIVFYLCLEIKFSVNRLIERITAFSLIHFAKSSEGESMPSLLSVVSDC